MKSLFTEIQIIVLVPVMLLGSFLGGCDKTPVTPLQMIEQSAQLNTININVFQYCPQAENVYKQIFVANLSYILKQGQLLNDYDRDGVTDVDEAGMGLNSLNPDTSGQGFGDLASFIVGEIHIDRPCNSPGVDSNHDGLRDCARQALGLSTTTFTTAGDGVPDYLKARAGLDPKDPEQSMMDPMGDGYTNLQKLQMNLPILETATADQLKFAIQYQVKPSTNNQPGCYDFQFSNIPLASTTNGNYIRLYFVELTPYSGGRTQPGVWALESRFVEISAQQTPGLTLSYQYSNLGVL